MSLLKFFCPTHLLRPLASIALLLLALPAVASFGDPMAAPAGMAVPDQNASNSNTPTRATLPIVRIARQGPRVLMGEKWYKAGDDIEGARISSIRPTGIELRRDGVKEHIPLLPAVRQPLPKR